MRVNLPVNTTQYPFPSGQTLVSTTDTKGRILYCNPAFVEVSGYQREELLGQPHNLIRHPDMPEEAFRDMWETIASGRPWSAPVKNRRKNGEYYWVMANATPLMENGHPVGYMSVRTEATPDQIRAAEALYATMRAEKERGQVVHTLSAGRLVKRTLWGQVAERLRLGIPGKLLLTLGALLAGFWLLEHFLPTGWPGASVAAPVLDVLMVLVAWRYLARLVMAPLDSLVASANRMAGGDLTQVIQKDRDDQLGDLQQALNQLNVNLRSVVRDARQESGEMANATTEIAQGNQDLSQRTETQASNLEQTAASMTQITETVRQTAESSRQASDLSSQVSETTTQSSDAVNDLVLTMQEIQKASARIGDITQVIDGIAFQTNILALNAAVEAARAGEQGRGFAVVAAEVRSLDQRAATAAKEIKQLIDNSVDKVNEGQNKTEAVKATMQLALQGVQQVNVLMTEITHAANEQLSGISQINAAITQMDTITQQNAALVEEIAASAVSLENLSQNVTETVKVFKIDNTSYSQGNAAVALRRQNKALAYDSAD